jgi:hypothetical protein
VEHEKRLAALKQKQQVLDAQIKSEKERWAQVKGMIEDKIDDPS